MIDLPRGTLRIGTRGSPLAVTQTGWVADRLRERWPGLEVEIRRIKTSGDRLVGPLQAAGGKGLFTKEIEEALLAGDVDAGVHSLKDLPANLGGGLAIAAVPVREDARDVLISGSRGGIDGLAHGARVGTGSLRRQALLRHFRPDLDVVGLRGNVDTRLRRWRDGELDAVVLARAGLRRLGLDVPEAEPLPPEDFVPAIGQGALAIEAAPENGWWEVLHAIDDDTTARAVEAERAFLATVGGDCRTPIAAHAVVVDGDVALRALVASPDGRRLIRGERAGAVAVAGRLGEELARDLLDRGGREILAELAP